MANARKCDRCGKCYNPLDMKGMSCRFRNPILQSENDIREGVVGKLMFDDSPDAYIDLCPECAEMFEAFMSCCDLPEVEEDHYKELVHLRKVLDESVDFHNRMEKTLDDLKEENNEILAENETLKKDNNRLAAIYENLEEAYDSLLKVSEGYERDLNYCEYLLQLKGTDDPEEIFRLVVNMILEGIEDADPENLKFSFMHGLRRAVDEHFYGADKPRCNKCGGDGGGTAVGDCDAAEREGQTEPESEN